MSWSQRIDKIIEVMKWPAAAMAIALTPLLAWSLVLLVWRAVLSPWSLLPFGAGIAAFVFVWRRFLRNNRFGRFLITVEHESTHALFAFLTLHKIVGFRASLGSGGQVRFIGQGNWLITVAPYFFPTASLILFLLAYVLPFPALPWQGFLLGIALAYHVISTARETHRDQTDIKQLGTAFCWLFLPAANLAVVGLLISFAHAGSTGLEAWFSDTFAPLTALSPTVETPLE